MGLQHSNDPNDLMYPRVDLAHQTFQDRESLVASPKYCQNATQNSHRRLLELVGAWPGGPKPDDDAVALTATAEEAPAMGCSMGAGAQRGRGGLPALCLVALMLFAVRPCRRRCGSL
jgi:hypothetical protein